jgi:hypothetical protein
VYELMIARLGYYAPYVSLGGARWCDQTGVFQYDGQEYTC